MSSKLEVKHEGLVEWFDAKLGYGFLAWNKNGVKQKDIFVYFSDIICDGFRTLKKGQKVSFGIGVNNTGAPKAIDVIVIDYV